MNALIKTAKRLAQRVDELNFGPPTTHVYNPLQYAWNLHRQYLKNYARPSCRVLFLGMNPGPWGMAQTGIPFGEVDAVRNWLGISGTVSQPDNEHPKRPVQGLACPRSEVSGRRLWGLFRDRFSDPDAFFDAHFVANYCPLVFMENTARNRTPDKLAAEEREPLVEACDDALAESIDSLAPEWVVGVGAYAESAAKRVVSGNASIKIGRILHPSPASPAANRGWAEAATGQLQDLGIW